jgi:WD40 repeat protein/predicted enzyme related to lactoylglutathione lyase
MLITGIDHVQITAPRGSEDRVRAFYGGVLGLKEIPKPSSLQARGGVWFQCGDLQLHVGTEADVANERSRRHVAFRVDHLDAVREALLAHGHPIEDDQPEIEGVRRLHCRDAVGNRVEFVEVIAGRAGGRLGQPELLAEYSAGEGDVERLTVSPDGAWLAAGTSDEGGSGRPGVFIWRLGQPGEPEVEIETPASVWELAFSPGGRELACLTEDGSLETWRVGDFESDQFAELPEGSAGLAYSRDGGLLAVGAGDKVEVYRPGLDHLHTIRPSLGLINTLAFDPHDTLAISGEAERIQLWQLRPVQVSSWEVLGHEAPAVQARFNPAHPVLAAITDSDQVLVWDVNQGPEEPADLTGEMVNVDALAFSPDGEWLAVGDEDGRVALWDWQGRRLALQIETHAPVLALAFSPDGAQLIVGHESGRVRTWRIRN